MLYFEFLEKGRYLEKDINLDHIFLTASMHDFLRFIVVHMAIFTQDDSDVTHGSDFS